MQIKDHGRRRRIALVAIVCLPLLAGCGESKKDTASTSTSTAAATGGTIEDQLGFTRKGVAAASAKVENSIAACMKAEGFDYVPVDSVAQQAALTGKPNMSDAEYEQQFGYGITTLYGRANAQTDPNATIRAGLGEADRAAYDRALSGGKPDQTFAFAVDTGDFTELGGCTKKATDKAFGGTQLLQTLQRKLDELDDSIAADQRMVHAQEAWRACVKDATGSEYEDAESIENEIKQRFEQVAGSVVPPGEVAPPGTQVDMAALRKLQQAELDLFRKDVGCERQHIDPVETKVRQEKETKFKSDNADLLRKVKPLGT
jgi:outer membrane murein-binding lipoprotein Lpp